MYRIGLDLTKKDNFQFFDFDAPLCLSVFQNAGVAVKLTPRILGGLRSGVLLDLDGVIDLTTGQKKAVPQVEETLAKEVKEHQDNTDAEVQADAKVQENGEEKEVTEPKQHRRSRKK